MCPCSKETKYVCTSCFHAIKRDARWNPMSEVRKHHGDWKCDAVFAPANQ